MNIIEQVFCSLKKEVFNDRDRYHTIRSLRNSTNAAWNRLRNNEEFSTNRVDSFRRRLNSIIQNNGWNSKY
jgi:hypothetical protein